MRAGPKTEYESGAWLMTQTTIGQPCFHTSYRPPVAQVRSCGFVGCSRKQSSLRSSLLRRDDKQKLRGGRFQTIRTDDGDSSYSTVPLILTIAAMDLLQMDCILQWTIRQGTNFSILIHVS